MISKANILIIFMFSQNIIDLYAAILGCGVQIQYEDYATCIANCHCERFSFVEVDENSDDEDEFSETNYICFDSSTTDCHVHGIEMDGVCQCYHNCNENWELTQFGEDMRAAIQASLQEENPGMYQNGTGCHQYCLAYRLYTLNRCLVFHDLRMQYDDERGTVSAFAFCSETYECSCMPELD